jgi:hypothetical protein
MIMLAMQVRGGSAGQLVTYMYITPTTDTCVNGEDWLYKQKAEADVWYTMYMYIKLNTPGKCCRMQGLLA